MMTHEIPRNTALQPRLVRRGGLCEDLFVRFLLGILVVGTAANAGGHRPTPLQHQWEVQPDLGDIWNASNTARSTYIDVEDLASDLALVRLDTARMICINYDRLGFANQERAIELMFTRVASADESLVVRRAMMSALCLLDDGTHAGKLWEASRSDPVLDRIVQRALVKWKSTVARDVWRKSLLDPTTSTDQALLAIEGLGLVGTTEDSVVLRELLESDSAAAEQRICAARALGALQTSDLIDLAEKYLGSDFPDRDRIAIDLMRNHSTPEALRIIRTVYQNGGEPARREAASAIENHFPEIAEELIPEWLRDRDMHFRLLTLQVVSMKDSGKTMEVAQLLLKDEDDRIRRAARRALFESAKNGNQQPVFELIKNELAGDDWRSMEQAIILATELQDKETCERLLELLDHPQPEVHMHAAWALTELSERGPIVDKVFEQASTLTDGLENGTGPFGKSYSIKLSLMLECLGRHRYEPAYPMLMKYVPKNDFKMGNLNRASAIWSISQLRKGTDDPDLRAKFRERITDMPPDKPENYLVRFASILALGELAHQDSFEVIDQYGGTPPNPLGYAAKWAKEQITTSGK